MVLKGNVNMSIESLFKNFTFIDSVENRPIICWGIFEIAEKTIKRMNKKVNCFIDNNPSSQNTVFLDLNVFPPSHLNSFKIKPFIIICTTSVNDVAKQLSELGYKESIDFIASPILNDLIKVLQLENFRAKMLFTSGAPKSKKKEVGGGIYELTIDKKTKLKKIFNNPCHSILKFNKNFIAVDSKKGVYEFDSKYNIIRTEKIPPGRKPHGIAYNHKKKEFFVNCSATDSTLKLDKNLKIIEEFHFSEKFRKFKKPHHHLNDICFVNDSLYLSMFSYSGNFKNDCFDGVVCEIDMMTGECVGVIKSGLWMPHSIKFFDDGLVVLDSLRGTLLKNNFSISGTFPGFLRGLDYNGQFFFIGQSRNRAPSKKLGISNNISIDSGIIIFDEETKLSRTIYLPPEIYEIHSLVII